MLSVFLFLLPFLVIISIACGKKKKNKSLSSVSIAKQSSLAIRPAAPLPPSCLIEKPKSNETPKTTEAPKVKKVPVETNEVADKTASKVGSAQLEEKESKTKEETKTKVDENKDDMKQEDSFEKLQPRKAEAARAKDIKDEKVANKGDYKTWAKFDNDDFDKSL